MNLYNFKQENGLKLNNYIRSFSTSNINNSIEKIKDNKFNITNEFMQQFADEKFRKDFIKEGGLNELINYYDNTQGENHNLSFFILEMFFNDGKDAVVTLVKHNLLPTLLNTLFVPQLAKSGAMSLINISYELYETEHIKNLAKEVIPLFNNIIQTDQAPEIYEYIPQIIINLSYGIYFLII